MVLSTTSEVDRETVDAARLLSRAALFSAVGASGLVDLARQAVTRHLAAGDHLFHEGETGTSMYVLGHGRVRLYVTGPGGEQSTLALLSPPAAFGELAVFDQGPRSASAIAEEPSVVVGLSAPVVRRAYRRDPDLADSLLRSLAALVRQATDQRSLLVFHDLSSRVARQLLEEADRRGDGRAYVQGNVRALAARAGGSELAVRRILHSFERSGLIRRDGAGLVLERSELELHAGLAAEQTIELEPRIEL